MPNFNRTETKLKILSNKLIDNVITGLNKENKNATGSLARSLRSTTSGGSIISVQFKAKAYWQFVDKGRKPGSYVPIAPLVKWVRTKLNIADAQEARSVAFAISKNIKKNGIKATNIFTNAINVFKKDVEPMKRNELKEDVSASIREALKSK